VVTAYWVKHMIVIIRWCIQKFPNWAYNEMNNNKHSLRSNTTLWWHLTRLTHKIAIQLHLVADHLQFSLQVASPEMSGYTAHSTPKAPHSYSFVSLPFFRINLWVAYTHLKCYKQGTEGTVGSNETSHPLHSSSEHYPPHCNHCRHQNKMLVFRGLTI
jgi:hypothetical protein